MSSSQEFDGPTMTGGALLRQFEPLRRDGATLHILGNEAKDLEAASQIVGWKAGPLTDSKLVVIHSPEAPVADSDLQAAGESSADAVCVVGPDADNCKVDGFELLRSQSMRRYISLNTWFRNTAKAAHVPGGLIEPAASLLRATKVSDVVGSRMCGLKEKEIQVARYQRSGSAESRQSGSDVLKNLAMSFFGIGHLPLFAANFASMAVTLIALGLWFAGGIELMRPSLIGVLVISTIIGVILEPWSEHYYLAPDAREVVLDEVAGMSLALLFLPMDAGLLGFLVAFILFRFFDIFKFGVHWIEDIKIQGTVTYDDILAGLYAGICLWALFTFL